MFGRKKEEPSAQSVVDQAYATAPESGAGKGAPPTPKRKDQEAARKRPLVPNDRKASKAAERVAIQDQRQKMRQALDTGDERFLPPFATRGLKSVTRVTTWTLGSAWASTSCSALCCSS